MSKKRLRDSFHGKDGSANSRSCSNDTKKAPAKRIKPTTSRMIFLPCEIITRIFILSSNPHLPVVCRNLMHMLYKCSETVKVEWLLHRHNQNIFEAFEEGLRFPFFDIQLLTHFDRLYQQRTLEQNIPFTNKTIPRHLFSQTDTSLALQLLSRGGSPNKPQGYPLVKSAQLGRTDMVKCLIAHGADPMVRSNMALRVCAARNNRELVCYFLDELHVKPDSKTLEACVQKGLWDMVKILVDHGAVPDMSTINFTLTL
ncbi:hypothetical protein DFQ28_010552 [Apophysomyces sp. BC1034]|nr:hypothetical protein DFQ30_001568 [Apophysomyces sp. BC1015]KAG0183530.1 hypothetical protein DFQ29_002585 [Apophysomyces sp. BC1021]KAG0194469.1 hypothetical protein DFQ28_010552 [Apophysomyces sp. BC1034]